MMSFKKKNPDKRFFNHSFIITWLRQFPKFVCSSESSEVLAKVIGSLATPQSGYLGTTGP